MTETSVKEHSPIFAICQAQPHLCPEQLTPLLDAEEENHGTDKAETKLETNSPRHS